MSTALALAVHRLSRCELSGHSASHRNPLILISSVSCTTPCALVSTDTGYSLRALSPHRRALPLPSSARSALPENGCTHHSTDLHANNHQSASEVPTCPPCHGGCDTDDPGPSGLSGELLRHHLLTSGMKSRKPFDSSLCRFPTAAGPVWTQTDPNSAEKTANFGV